MRQDNVVGPIRELVEERLGSLFLDPTTLEWWITPFGFQQNTQSRAADEASSEAHNDSEKR